MKNQVNNEHVVLGCLSKLPKKILSIHGFENIPEFVLYDLCHEDCFNVKKAAYFVDNPDFNCCKGIAGYARSENYGDVEDIWQDPHAFTLLMRSCPFNQKVRLFEMKSVHGNGSGPQEIVDAIAHECAFQEPDCMTWKLKHDNIGMLVFDRSGAQHLDDVEEHLSSSVHLFGFCPVF